MKKEQFLSFSLPYELYCIVSGDATFKILSLHFENINLVRIHKTGYRDFPMTIPHIKPILRPLSDLTKPIEHNGEKFVPIESLKDVFMLEWCDLFDDSIDAILEFAKYNNFKKIEYLPFCIVQKLVEWKFDIAGLIEKGEAIDVNTLTENPYK